MLRYLLSMQIGCIATSAILHYFFTAAFAWLFCEVMAIVFFPWVSKNPTSFLLFFVVGWGKEGSGLVRIPEISSF